MRTGTLSARRRSRIKRNSSPLVSNVPTMNAVRPTSLGQRDREHGRAPPPRIACRRRPPATSTHASPSGSATARRDRRARLRRAPRRRAAPPGTPSGARPWPRAPAPPSVRRRPPLRLTSDAEQALLQVAIPASAPRPMTRLMRPLTMIATGSETAGRDADVLLDDEGGKVLFAGQAQQQVAHLATMTGASPSVGSSMTSSRGLPSSAREIASICCSPPESWPPPLPRRSARRGNVA